MMSFTREVAEEIGIPRVSFWTSGGCGYWAFLQIPELIRRGYTPLKDMACLAEGYLDTTLDWIPGMPNILLKDMPSFIRTTDPNFFLLNYIKDEVQHAFNASALILNTFDDLEKDVLNAIKERIPCPLYTLGPLLTFSHDVTKEEVKPISTSLWKEESECLDWLDSHQPRSVIYVNFGSITVLTPHQLNEFAWGLANSEKPFIWIIRQGLVQGESTTLSHDFYDKTKGRGLIASWCNQKKVLSHSSIGGFLTHSGWNSILESICSGVPVLCWPFFAEQQTNCRFACVEWGIGMEIGDDVKRQKVETQVKEMIEGLKGMKMRANAMKWKESSERAIGSGGSSSENLDRLVVEVLLKKHGE
ncbi:hypothetical protein AMTRI_Chr04g244600 [Amborella trichopoda]